MKNDDKEKNIHENHRNRLRERFAKSPESLSGHELLELALFSVLPRVNVNPVAHRLINRFGSIGAVLHAPLDELTQVEGIGPSAANFLSVTGALCDCVLQENMPAKKIYTFRDAEEFLLKFYRNQKLETFLAITLNAAGEVIGKETFSQREVGQVNVDLSDLTRVVSGAGVTSAIVAHNHPNGVCRPSDEDDVATEKLLFLCHVASIRLDDHLIVAGGKVFSYRLSGRLDYMRNALFGKGEKRY